MKKHVLTSLLLGTVLSTAYSQKPGQDYRTTPVIV